MKFRESSAEHIPRASHLVYSNMSSIPSMLTRQELHAEDGLGSAGSHHNHRVITNSLWPGLFKRSLVRGKKDVLADLLVGHQGSLNNIMVIEKQ